MKRRLRQPLSLTALAAAVAMALPCSGAAAAGAVSPLPASNYSIRAACAAPSPHHAGCLALQLVPVTAQAQEHTHPIGMVRAASQDAPVARSPAAGDFGLRPQDLHSAYSLPDMPQTQQTVALVDAYNDPTAEADLKTYDEEFGLPACTAANGCFEKVGETGSPSDLPFPQTTRELNEAAEGSKAEVEAANEAAGWDVEISLDIESAHATCEGCHILLVEAESTGYADLEAAERSAAELGANEISNSWGGSEAGVGVESDLKGPFNDPDVVITAAAGDDGFLGWDAEHSSERGFVNYPAASPHVVAVGGTRLAPLSAKGDWTGESVWNGDGASGGGCSLQFTAPLWQQAVSDWSSVGCGSKRVVSDVAADADPYTGVAIEDSSPDCKSGALHWCTYGGTSLASPIIAAVYALAGGADGVAYPAQTLYESELHAPATLHDVSSGSNGDCAAGYDHETGLSLCTQQQEAQASCSKTLACLTAEGYDGPSGVGTPDGILGFEPGQEEPIKEKPPKEPPQEEEHAKEEEPVKKEHGKEEESILREEVTAREKGLEAPRQTGPTPTPTPSPPPLIPLPGILEVGSTPAISTGAPIASLRVSGLALTTSALITLDRPRPATSKIGFSFRANVAGHLRIALFKRVRAHGHTGWSRLSRPVSVAVKSGPNSRRLSGRRPLMAGLYRLTLTPPDGPPSSIVFNIG